MDDTTDRLLGRGKDWWEMKGTSHSNQTCTKLLAGTRSHSLPSLYPPRDPQVPYIGLTTSYMTSYQTGHQTMSLVITQKMYTHYICQMYNCEVMAQGRDT